MFKRYTCCSRREIMFNWTMFNIIAVVDVNNVSYIVDSLGLNCISIM